MEQLIETADKWISIYFIFEIVATIIVLPFALMIFYKIVKKILNDK